MNVDYVLLSYADPVCGWLSYADPVCEWLSYEDLDCELLSCALVHDGLSLLYDVWWALCGELSRQWSLLWSLLKIKNI